MAYLAVGGLILIEWLAGSFFKQIGTLWGACMCWFQAIAILSFGIAFLGGQSVPRILAGSCVLIVGTIYLVRYYRKNRRDGLSQGPSDSMMWCAKIQSVIMQPPFPGRIHGAKPPRTGVEMTPTAIR